MVQAPHRNEAPDRRCGFRPTPLLGGEIPLLVGGAKRSWSHGRGRACAEYDCKMVERGVSRVITRSPSPWTLTQNQVKASTETDSLLDTVADCLRFVTEFFEVIGQSGPHLYHSALLLAPRSSIVWKLYRQMVRSPIPRVVSGIPISWDSCTASAGTASGVRHALWSPCGQFIAVSIGVTIDIRDSSTLERLSTLRPPHRLTKFAPHTLAFSSNGRLLAGVFFR